MNALRRKCCYDGCRQPAKTTWAYVPICQAHYDTIMTETQNYYKGKITAPERVHYRKIERLTPWEGGKR